MKTLVNKQNPQIQITAPEIEVQEESEMYLIPVSDYCIPMCIDDWTLVEEKPKHTEVWVEGRTIFEQDANTFVNTEGEPEAKLTGWVARDNENNSYFGFGLFLFNEKPERTGDCWSGAITSHLPWRLFPDLKWEDEPVKVEITIRKK